MSRSQNEAPFPSEAYFFEQGQRRFLHQASISPFVYPGGSKFESRGTIGPGPENLGVENRPMPGIKLKINIDQKEFWYFEPIELDIEITSSKLVEIPNRVDPGYEEFCIHITKPDGTIFKYSSPRHYCQNPSTLKIDGKHPFRRDISIFGQSGGYTFDTPGIYRIQCFFRISKENVLISNVLEIYVKDLLLDNGNFLLTEKSLTQQQTSLLLYHRSGQYRKAIVEELEVLGRKEQKNVLGTNIDYALARYYFSKYKNLDKKGKEKAYYKINKILDKGKLSKNRQKQIEQLLNIDR
jgi:hypothetical protein